MHSLKTLSLLSLCLASLSALGAERPLQLFPGWSTLAGAGVRAKAADPAVAEVAVTPQGVQVTAKREGHTTVTLERADGTSQTLPVEVANAGWNLVPVVTAARDLPEGTVVQLDDLKQRLVPAFLITSSVVRPDAANYIMQQRLLVAAQAGDLLLWSQFASPANK